ncbi:MAG: extracellular solute-binding protein [Anaerolineaceae bacterium]|nr:MAG: extracellular solute-binding protein [Anaerolineaceae bacterium]
MTGRLVKVIGLLLLLLATVSCRSNTAEDEINGRVTLWHGWSAEEAFVLGEALSQFQEINPDVRIISVAIPQDQILNEFHKAGEDGLGPDLLIGKDSWIGELAESGLIRPLSPDEIPPSLIDLRNRSLTQYQDQFFGIPMSLAPRALYYNKRLVSKPPASLDELLQEWAAGNQVAFVPRFEEAYWGIQAFGEGLFDEQNRFTLAESGFTEWLSWLDEVQSAPGVILNVDDESLLELFATEQIAYYVAGPDKQALISELMDQENPFEFGIASLPGGPQGAGGPLLPAETLLLYAFASPEQTRIASDLAAFLVNQQQSIRFMRDLGRVPANPAVQVDQRIYPLVNGFSQQANTAVVIPNEIPSDPFFAAGDRAYVSTLSGLLAPEEAVCNFGQEVAAILGYTSREMSLPYGCNASTK